MHGEREGLSLGVDCDIHPDVVFEIDPGARIMLGDRVSIRRGTTLQANRGSQILIGDDVAIGENAFISAMVGIIIGSGSGVSNQVDIRDHNHRVRSADLGALRLQPWASGFEAAPIVVEKGVVLSNKVSVTAGVVIASNSIVGANSVVTRHVESDAVVVGGSVRTIREFDGVDVGETFRPPFSVGWIGTSIMEHRSAWSAALEAPWPVPDPGTTVEVTGIDTGGYVRAVTDDLHVRFPHLDMSCRNHAVGGANSRHLVDVCRNLATNAEMFDLAFFGCGLNDVWRGFQGRVDEAVELAEFIHNVSSCLSDLSRISRLVVYVEESTFGPELEGLPTREMNLELARYMRAACGIATAQGCEVVPVTEIFNRVARAIAPASQLWKDGVHLSRLGDHLLAQLVLDHLRSSRTIERLSKLPRVDREVAPQRYRDLLMKAAPIVTGRLIS